MGAMGTLRSAAAARLARASTNPALECPHRCHGKLNRSGMSGDFDDADLYADELDDVASALDALDDRPAKTSSPDSAA